MFIGCAVDLRRQFLEIHKRDPSGYVDSAALIFYLSLLPSIHERNSNQCPASVEDHLSCHSLEHSWPRKFSHGIQPHE